ncbi:hypothetical protein AB4Z54_05010 [Streptomyces sp. MCAF7]
MNKAKRTKAIGALRKEGMSAENAVRHLKYLDMDEPFGPQIEELREDFPTLFEPATDTDDKSKGKPADDDRPMTRAEVIAARLRGEHVEGMTYRSKGTRGSTTTSKSAQANADHLRAHSKTAPPPVRKWVHEPKDLNAGHASAPQRPATSSADQIAARLKGN